MQSCNLTHSRPEILQNRPFKNKCKRPAKNSHWWIAIWIEVLRPQAIIINADYQSTQSTKRQLNIPELRMGQDGSPWLVFQFHYPISLYHHLLPKWSRGNSHKEAILFLYIIFSVRLASMLCGFPHWSILNTSSDSSRQLASTSSPLAANLARCSDVAAWARREGSARHGDTHKEYKEQTWTNNT